MSQENVEIVREAHRAFNAGDLDRFAEFWHPECEYRPGLEGAFEGAGGVYRGHEGIRRWGRTLHAAFLEMNTEIEEIRDWKTGCWSRQSSTCGPRRRTSASTFPSFGWLRFATAGSPAPATSWTEKQPL